MYDEIEMPEVPARVDSQAGEVASPVSEVPQSELEPREKDPRRFYVYAYLREDGTPYYIGKGTGRRAYNKQHNMHLPVDRSNRIQIIERDMLEGEALALERALIIKYGRIDIGTGILRNLTDGGEGPSGMVRSPETRAKISRGNMGKPKSPSHCANISKGNKGKPKSPEHAAKCRLAAIGRKLSEEHKRKMSAALLGKEVSSETRAKISHALSGSKNPRFGKPASGPSKANLDKGRVDRIRVVSRPVVCVETGEKYDSIKSVASYLGRSYSFAYNRITGNRECDGVNFVLVGKAGNNES